MYTYPALGLSFLSVASAVVFSRQGTVTPLTTTQIDSFTPYTHFASAVYCDPSTTITWACGVECDANPGFIPVAAGGNSATIQFWYVGYSPSLDEVIVAHEGTEPAQLLADLTDVNLLQAPLDSTLFPGLGLTSGILVHAGFAAAHARTATSILAAVQNATVAHNTDKVTITGHSLGAALALLDAVYLPLHLPSTVQFKLVAYGLPRVGNPNFAQYVDAHLPNLTRINNKEDPVPIVPIISMGYEHPHGEVHITDTGVWESCSGNENPSGLCTVGDGLVRNVFDHDGPYNGISLGFFGTERVTQCST